MPIRSLKILATLAGTLLLTLWLMQHNIEQYWQQTYYRQSPLAVLQENALWRSGNALKQYLNCLLRVEESRHPLSPVAVTAPVINAPLPAAVADPIAAENEVAEVPLQEVPETITKEAKTAGSPWQNILADTLNVTHPIVTATYLPEDSNWTSNIISSTPAFAEAVAELAEEKTATARQNLLPPPEETATETAATNSEKLPIRLRQNDRVLLIGDSMMQSLAPHIQRELLGRYHIKSINRGKPSSGLRYPEYYNWPEQLAMQLEEHPDVRLIIVLLGANDPQDTPNPAAPAQKLRFGTPEWENYYRGEIRKILYTATASGAQTLWIGPPLMKAGKYSKKVAYLDGLIADEVEKAAQHYQNTNRLFAKKDGGYTAFLPDGRGKNIAVRKGDGIHLTGHGEKILTHHILQHIHYAP